jgi:hypothetical protein
MKKVLLAALLLLTGAAAYAQVPVVVEAWTPHEPPVVLRACQGRPPGTQVQVTFPDGRTRFFECWGQHPHHFGPNEVILVPR